MRPLLICLLLMAGQGFTNETELGQVINTLLPYKNAHPGTIMADLDKIEQLLDQGIPLASALGGKAPGINFSTLGNVALPIVYNPSLNMIRALWIEQLKDNIDAAEGVYNENTAILKEWMYPAIRWDYKEQRIQIMRCFLDGKKAVILLKKESHDIKPYAKQDVLYSDNFNTGASLNNWTLYGDGNLSVVNGKLKYFDPGSKPDSHLWTKQVFNGNFAISYEMIPLKPIQGGHIISYNAMPRKPGGDLSGSGSGQMTSYYNNITCYHISLARGYTSVSNMRKCGPGLYMCANSWDPCEARTDTHQVEVMKIDNNHMMFVDGILIHYYVDFGVYGDSLYNGGYVGIRNYTGMTAYYDDFVISRLTGSTGLGKVNYSGKTSGLAMDISPNPCNPEATIKIRGITSEGMGKGPMQLLIYNTEGRMILRYKNIIGTGFTFNTQSLSSGPYIAKLTAGKKEIIKRFHRVK
jgi:hypothetical protein